MKVICKREITDTRNNLLFVKKVVYEANEMKNDYLQIKDDTNCMRYLPKQIWKEHFDIVGGVNIWK